MKWLLYIWIIVCSAALHAEDADISGSVLFVKGEVTVAGKKAIKGLNFNEQTEIRTGNKSLVVLSLKGSGKIKIGENSIVEVKSFMTKNEPAVVHMTKGEAFFHIVKRKLSKGNSVRTKEKFVVKNSFASMGVRGTSFYVSSSQKSKNDLWMCVKSGEVAIKNSKDKSEVLVRAGEGVQVTSKSSPTKPKFLPWTKKLNWEIDPRKGSLENTISINEAYVDLLGQDYD